MILDLGSDDLPSAIATAAGGDASLEAFFRATSQSQAGKPGPRLIAADRERFESGNLLLEPFPEGFDLGSKDFVELMKLVVETEDFSVGSLDMCDFERGPDHGRLVSYILHDELGGADSSMRVAVIEAGDHVWAITSFVPGTTGEELNRTLSTIVSGFRSPP